MIEMLGMNNGSTVDVDDLIKAALPLLYPVLNDLHIVFVIQVKGRKIKALVVQTVLNRIDG